MHIFFFIHFSLLFVWFCLIITIWVEVALQAPVKRILLCKFTHFSVCFLFVWSFQVHQALFQVHHPARPAHIPPEMLAKYSFHGPINTQTVCQTHHRHPPFVCMMTTERPNGRHDRPVCQEGGKYQPHTHTFLYAYFLHRIHRRTFKIINVKCLTEYFCICFLIIRYRLNSASDEEDGYPVDEDFDEHLHYMAARERLQEFPGRIPQRKKKETSSQSEKKSRVSTSFFCLFLFY